MKKNGIKSENYETNKTLNFDLTLKPIVFCILISFSVRNFSRSYYLAS